MPSSPVGPPIECLKSVSPPKGEKGNLPYASMLFCCISLLEFTVKFDCSYCLPTLQRLSEGEASVSGESEKFLMFTKRGGGLGSINRRTIGNGELTGPFLH